MEDHNDDSQTSTSKSMVYRKFRTSGFEFEVLARYDIQKFCGYGAFGVVTSAIDNETGKQVAIKKIMGAMIGPVKCKQTLREIKLMKSFSHENVTKILDLIPPPFEKHEFEDLYIVEDLMETDLHRVIYSRQELSLDHAQCFIYQILRGLKYLHSANVIHRDLKPSNILVNSNCDIKICDFGLSCLAEDDNLEKTEYVVTRWYRAPEVMLARQEYTKAIDIWSVGCIFAELLARKPLFPGEDYLNQLEIICKKIGKPTEEELNFVTSQRAKEFILALPFGDSNSKTISISDHFPKYKNELSAVDLVEKMLKFQPQARISVCGALEHLFLEPMHNPDDEPIANFHASFDFETDPSINASCNEGDEKSDEIEKKLKQLIWNEIRDFHPYIPLHIPSHSSESIQPAPQKSTITYNSPNTIRQGNASVSSKDNKDTFEETQLGNVNLFNDSKTSIVALTPLQVRAGPLEISTVHEDQTTHIKRSQGQICSTPMSPPVGIVKRPRVVFQTSSN